VVSPPTIATPEFISHLVNPRVQFSDITKVQNPRLHRSSHERLTPALQARGAERLAQRPFLHRREYSSDIKKKEQRASALAPTFPVKNPCEVNVLNHCVCLKLKSSPAGKPDVQHGAIVSGSGGLFSFEASSGSRRSISEFIMRRFPGLGRSFISQKKVAH